MNDKELLLFALENRDKLREILPTPFEITMIGYIKTVRLVTHKQIAKQFDISTSNACIRLKSLFEKGYLSRNENYENEVPRCHKQCEYFYDLEKEAG